MTPLLDNVLARIGGDSHARVVDAAANLLRRGSLEVETEPQVGRARPDIVIHDASGAVYLIEIKSSAPSAFLGAVAQVEAQVDDYRRARGKDAQGVLVFSGHAPDDLDNVARHAGVELVHVPSFRPTAVAESLSAVVSGRPASPSSEDAGQGASLDGEIA